MIVLILSVVISLVIVVSLWNLTREVFSLLVLGMFAPLEYRIFQSVFGMIMNLFITESLIWI
ncbi:MAG: phosphate-starvation-inducible PsiE family protein [Thiotrichales bacterium]